MYQLTRNGIREDPLMAAFYGLRFLSVLSGTVWMVFLAFNVAFNRAWVEKAGFPTLVWTVSMYLGLVFLLGATLLGAAFLVRHAVRSSGARKARSSGP